MVTVGKTSASLNTARLIIAQGQGMRARPNFGCFLFDNALPNKNFSIYPEFSVYRTTLLIASAVAPIYSLKISSRADHTNSIKLRYHAKLSQAFLILC